MVDLAGFFAAGLAEQQERSRGLAIQEGQLAIQQRGLELREQEAQQKKVQKELDNINKQVDVLIEQGRAMAKIGALTPDLQAELVGSVRELESQLAQRGIPVSGLAQRAEQALRFTPTLAQETSAVTDATIDQKQAFIDAGVAPPVDTRTAVEIEDAKQADALELIAQRNRDALGQIQARAEADRETAKLAGTDQTLTGRQVTLPDGHSSPVVRIGKSDFWRDQRGVMRSADELPGGAQVSTTQQGQLPASRIDQMQAGVQRLEAAISAAEQAQVEIEDTDIGTVGGFREVTSRASRAIGDMVRAFMPPESAKAVEDAINAVVGEDGQLDPDATKIEALEFRLQEALINGRQLAKGKAPTKDEIQDIRERTRLRGGIAGAGDVRARLRQVVLEMKENVRQIQARAAGRIQALQEQSQPNRAARDELPVFTLEELEAIANERLQ